MLRADVFMAEPIRFFNGVLEDSLTFLAQRHFRRSGNAFLNLDVRFDFIPNRLDMRTGHSTLAHDTEQEVLGLNVPASVLTGFVACEENCASGLLGISLKHFGESLSVHPTLDLPVLLAFTRTVPVSRLIRRWVPGPRRRSNESLIQRRRKT